MSRREQPDVSQYPILWELTPRWADVDTYGHVNNAVYYEYFDTAVNGWLCEVTGTDIRLLESFGVVAATSCEFLREIHFGRRLRVGVRVDRVGGASVTYSLAIFAGSDEDSVACARGTFVHVYVDPESRQPSQIPQVVRDAARRILM